MVASRRERSVSPESDRSGDEQTRRAGRAKSDGLVEKRPQPSAGGMLWLRRKRLSGS
jgi:hypothetical protein